MIKDLAQFTKIKSTPHMTILRHPSGHEIRIAHAGLGEGLKKQLHDMPVHLADGTPDGPLASSASAGPDQLANIESQIAQTPAQDIAAPEESTAHAIGRNLGAIGKMLPTPTPIAFAKGIVDQGGKFLSGLTGEDEGQGQAQPDQSKSKLANYQLPSPDQGSAPQQQSPQYTSPYEEEAQAAQRQAESVQKLQTWSQGHMAAIDKERQSVQDDIQKGHIDPNQYIHEMGAGQKVSTAIGLLFGGLGAGATGGKNVALDYLNQQVDRNINSQMADLGRKQNLLGALTHQFGNVRDAADMSRSIQNDLYSAQMQQAMTKIQDPVKRQQMLTAMQQFQAQGNAAAQKVAFRQGAQSAAKQGGMDPTIMIRAMVPDQKEQEPYFKELATAQGMVKQRDNLMNTFDELTHINTIGNTLAHPIDTMAANQRAQASLAALAKESEGRVTEADVAFLEGLLPKKGVSAQENAKRRQAMNDYVSQKMNFPRLDSIGANPSVQSSRSMARPNMNVAPPVGPQSRGQTPMKVNFNGG